MILITVRFYGVAYDIVESRERSFNLYKKSSILDLLKYMIEIYPRMYDFIFDEHLEFRDYLTISVNNVDIRGIKGVNTLLKDGDIVYLMPPIGGG
jgi:molybdopterin synthase sulfur carrier subunit